MFTLARDFARTNELAPSEARAHEGLAHVALRDGDVEGARQLWTTAAGLYPASAADARHPRRHLAGDLTVTCLRCEVAGFLADDH